MTSIEQLKHAAALRAVEYVRDGMVVGLGTGSTCEHALHEFGHRVAEGLNIKGVPTSERTARLATEVGIPLTTLDDSPLVNVTVDGADEVDLKTFDAIKGLGGALLREKLVALASEVVILTVDETKVVERLGEHAPVPVEVVPFGWTRTCAYLEELGCQAHRRIKRDGSPSITDSANYLLDCAFGLIDDPASLGQRIKAISGVIEHGIFAGIAHRVIIARQSGVEVVEKPGAR